MKDMDMPRRKKTVAGQAAARGPLPALPDELIDQLVKGPISPEQVQDLMLAFNKAVIERAMSAEMNLHLGYPPGDAKPTDQANERNGSSGKTVLTERGAVRIEVPRDRDASFEPILIPKHERRFRGFDERIIAMYARGMSVREIQAFIAEHYGTQVSPDFISSVTDEVMAEAAAWQNRPLEPMYPVVFFDALRVKIRGDGVVSNKAVYLALGVLPDGSRDVLGLWIEQTEGAKFWLKVFNELKTRGLADILIAVVDGLKGLTEAIGAVYPKTTVQTCIVHLIRNSLDYASWKDRKSLAAALKPIYTAPSAEAAAELLEAFAASPWSEKYPSIVASWRRAWEHVVPFFVFPPDIRRVIYTTNAIESLNMQLRKIIKTRGHFPTDEAATKLLWLAIRNVLAKTVRPTYDWKGAMNQFAVLFGERFTLARA
jgi:transposase-like protein